MAQEVIRHSLVTWTAVFDICLQSGLPQVGPEELVPATVFPGSRVTREGGEHGDISPPAHQSVPFLVSASVSTSVKYSGLLPPSPGHVLCKTL